MAAIYFHQLSFVFFPKLGHQIEAYSAGNQNHFIDWQHD